MKNFYESFESLKVLCKIIFNIYSENCCNKVKEDQLKVLFEEIVKEFEIQNFPLDESISKMYSSFRLLILNDKNLQESQKINLMKILQGKE